MIGVFLNTQLRHTKGRIVKKTRLNRALTGLAFAAGSLAVAASAQAQTTTTSASSGYSMYAPGSAYVGLNAGRSRYGDRTPGLGGFINDRSNNAYSLYGGSYFNNNLGFELGYNDFGRVNRYGGTTSANGISLSLVGKLPLGQSFNLLGRLGGSYIRTDMSTSAASGVAGGRDSRFGVSYGIGAEWNFTPAWSAVLQYDEYNPRFNGGSSERLNTTTLGVRYHF